MYDTEEPTFWRKDSLSMWFVFALITLFAVLTLNTFGVFDSDEIREEKRLSSLEYELKRQEREKISNEAKQHIKDGTLSCTYITELLEYDSRTKSAITSGNLETSLRLYWNANNCGFEWNWYD